MSTIEIAGRRFEKTQLILIGIALVFGVIAFVLIKSVFGDKKPKTTVKRVPTVEYLVADKDLGIGQKIRSSSFRWERSTRKKMEFSQDFIFRGSTEASRVVGSRLEKPVSKGQPITKNSLSKTNIGGILASILPGGRQAVSVSISSVSRAGGFILPNDRVNVILTRKFKLRDIKDPAVRRELQRRMTGDDFVESKVILSNVRVLAINEVFRDSEKENKPTIQKGGIATLELLPEQVPVIVSAQEAGKLSLSLWSVKDNAGRDVARITPETQSGLLEKAKPVKSVRIVRHGTVSEIISND